MDWIPWFSFCFGGFLLNCESNTFKGVLKNAEVFFVISTGIAGMLSGFIEFQRENTEQKILNAGQVNWRVDSKIDASCINLLLE